MISRRPENWAVHILSYLANFIGVTPFILTNILEKASIVSTENFESLLRYLGQLDKNILNVTAGNRTGTIHSFLTNYLTLFTTTMSLQHTIFKAKASI